MTFNYGDAYLRHPIERGTAVFTDGSRLKTHDIMNPLPEWMLEADVIFTDSPWNTGNLRTFYTKADIQPGFDANFGTFARRLFECIVQINPRVCYLEIGKEYLADYIMMAKSFYKHVTFFNSTYYHRPENHCYVVRASDKAARGIHLDGIDEEDIISWVGANEDASCIGDLCMGRGLVAMAAYRNGKRFVGTELNHKRLSVALERLTAAGAAYHIEQ